MSIATLAASANAIVYPESDGLPMADNSKQFTWIFVLAGNLAALFRDVADVFVCGDMFWYPVEGHPEIRNAPDVFVIFGRPKGHRSSYRQWEEGNVPMTVVFEVASPSNTWWEMADKLAFYDEHGVEEYYVYDPDTNRLLVYLRRRETLHRVWQEKNFVSPKLGIRFDLSGEEMVVYYPSGERFLTFEELKADQELSRQQAEQARRETEQARQDAERARRETEEARQEAEQARQRAVQAQQRADRLLELVRKARRQQATPEELAELERLEEEFSPRSPG